MKRIIMILLVVLSVSLIACNAKPAQEQTTQTLPPVSDQQTTEENYTTLVVLSVNPSFDIYTKDGVVLEVKGSDPDGEKVLGNDCFQGIPLADCFRSILARLHQNGYLNPDAKMEIKTYTYPGISNYDVPGTIETELKAFMDQKALSFFYDISNEMIDGTNEPQPGQESTQPAPTESTGATVPESTDTQPATWLDESRYSVVERDEAGNIVKTVEEIPAIEDTPARTETCFYKPDRTMWKRTIEESDCTITFEFADGVKVKEAARYQDGSYYETIYGVGGNLVSEVGANDLYQYETVYSAKGLREKETQTYLDGSRKTVVTYYEDGEKKSIATDLSDGNHSVVTFYPGGAVESDHAYGPNGDNKYYYDTNGNKTRYEGKDNRGNPVTGTYNPDGSGEFKTTLPDGSVVISYYDAKGNHITDKVQ